MKGKKVKIGWDPPGHKNHEFLVCRILERKEQPTPGTTTN